MDVNTIQKSRNRSLDLLKLIASYMVIFIHFMLYGEAGWVVNALARFAVPVFFMTSGYFSYMNGADKLKAKIVNIFKIYLVGFLLHFCFFCAVSLFETGIKGAFWYCVLYVIPVNIAKFVFFNLPRSSEHLWFLLALIYSYALQIFVVKRKISERVCLWVSGALLLVHLILGFGLSSFGIIVKNFYLRNFLLMGYPFFCFGLLIRKKEGVILDRVSMLGAVGILAAGIVETVAAYFISGENELYIGSVLVAFALFVMALKMKDKEFSPWLITLADTATVIYVIHIIVGNVVLRLLSEDAFLWKYFSPIIVCAAATVVSLLYKLTEKKIKKANRS